MAKVDIHPEIKDVVYKFSQGRSLTLRSTYKRNKEFLLETDIFSHPAWKEDSKAVDNTSSSVNKFNDTFGGVSLFTNISQGTSSIKSLKKETMVEVPSEQTAEAVTERIAPKNAGKKPSAKTKKSSKEGE